MTDVEILKYCGDSGERWAEMFCKIVGEKIKGHELESLDQDWITAWFANAIECSSDVRRWGKETDEVYDWMQERNLTWPLSKENKMLFNLTWSDNENNQ